MCKTEHCLFKQYGADLIINNSGHCTHSVHGAVQTIIIYQISSSRPKLYQEYTKLEFWFLFSNISIYKWEKGMATKRPQYGL